MIKNNTIKWLVAFILVFTSQLIQADEKVIVFAAASLTNAITDISALYEKNQDEKNQNEKNNPIKIVHSFAASSTLAKQIENGAPADIFISADTKWMNYLQDKKLINTASRKAFLGNKLVLIAPKGRGFNVKFDKLFDFSKSFDGRLCTGDIDSVPAGIYAKDALVYLNWWDSIKTRIVGTQDVRGALAFVERGECAAGIVYETDAKISTKVEIVGTFPEESHKPIVYPMAFVANAKNMNTPYFEYLQSDAALNIFKKYGFDILNN